MTDDDDELARLKARTPEPRPGLADAVMRQVALRPRPKRPWWTAFTRPRELVIRFRWSRVIGLAGAAAIAAAAMFVKLDGRRPEMASSENSNRQNVSSENSHPQNPPGVLVRFALPARAARAVSLAGDFNGWRPDSTPLARESDGTWTATLPLAPGTWSYSFVVDGKWVEDPAAESYRADGFGGRNALVRVGG